MNTYERATHLAAAAAHFPFLGQTTPELLLTLVAVELGDPEILDGFRLHGHELTLAVAPETILHVISGNTPAAGLQSLIRGLLLGAHNLCKRPAGGLLELAQFRQALPPELAARVEISSTLPGDWLARADALIVFGNDQTIAHFRGLCRPNQIFLAHGHRVSFGVVFDDLDFTSVADAARDASLFDQQGCLSPHVFYVAEDPLAYAAELAHEMELFETQHPRGAISLGEANSIRAFREGLNFRAANDDPVVVFQSSGTSAWTVAFDGAPGFPASPLNRFIFVKPLPVSWEDELASVRAHLSCAGLWPAEIEHARLLAGLGVSRICPLGQMQFPAWTWHQDGQAGLAPLVRWIDFEPGA